MTTLTTLPINAISIPGAQFKRNGLTIDKDATPKQLKLVGDFLGAVGDSADWWRADYVRCVTDRSTGDDQARTTCEGHGIEQASFYFYNSVTAIFPADMRNADLSFEHHREVVLGTNGDADEARQWLARAHAEGWGVPELRKALRQHNAEYHKDGRKPTGNGYSALLDANRWAKTQEKELPDYTPERASAILSDIEPLMTFIAKVEAIAGVKKSDGGRIGS